MLKTISNITVGEPFTLICKVLKAWMDPEKKFLVLRLKDFTQTKERFRKFELSRLKKDIHDSSINIDAWKNESKKVDVLVQCPLGGVVPHFKVGLVVCLKEVQCRAVYCGDTAIHELFVNNEMGNRLHIMTCEDLHICHTYRLERYLSCGDFPYIGTINIKNIRKGISFALFCKVVKCGTKTVTGDLVVRVTDSTLIKIITKKYDLDQSNRNEVHVFDAGSSEVDIFITSPPHNIDDMMIDTIMTLGPVKCNAVLCDGDGPSSTTTAAAVHELCVDASVPSFQMKIFDQNLRMVNALKRKLTIAPAKKRKRKKKNRRQDIQL